MRFSFIKRDMQSEMYIMRNIIYNKRFCSVYHRQIEHICLSLNTQFDPKLNYICFRKLIQTANIIFNFLDLLSQVVFILHIMTHCRTRVFYEWVLFLAPRNNQYNQSIMFVWLLVKHHLYIFKFENINTAII